MRAPEVIIETRTMAMEPRGKKVTQQVLLVVEVEVPQLHIYLTMPMMKMKDIITSI
jgi:hypothetical protein